MLVIFKEEML